MLIGGKSEDIDELGLGEDLLSYTRLGQEEGKSVWHVALFHQIGTETDSDFETQAVFSVPQVHVHLFVLQAELIVQFGPQLRFQRVQDTGIFHRCEKLLLELSFAGVATAG